MSFLKKNSYQPIIFFVIAVLTLSLGFYRNQWLASNQSWFNDFLIELESQVVGRLVISRQDGIFSHGGLTGRVENEGWTYEYKVKYQYEAYLQNLKADKFHTYNSQIGFQAILFSWLDKVTNFTNAENLEIFRIITSTISALAIALIILWFHYQFGFLTASVVLITALYSQWLTVFGKNLWWFTGAFFLPFVVSTYILFWEEKKQKYSNTITAFLIYMAIFIKCLFNGYEYVTTIIVMMITPCVYYAIFQKWSLWKFIKRTLVLNVAAAVGILTSFILLIYQISIVKGGVRAGLDHILFSFGKRTYGDASYYPEIFAPSLKSNVLSVIWTYLNGIGIDLTYLTAIGKIWIPQNSSRISFLTIIIMFLVATIILYVFGVYISTPAILKLKIKALIGVTWFSILAPVSWFVIFKGHSYIHTHMNYIVWQMPFTFFGFALCGLVLQIFCYRLIKIINKRRHNFVLPTP